MERNSFWKNPWSLLVAHLFLPGALGGFPWFVCFFCFRNGRLALVADRATLRELFKFLLLLFLP